MPQAAMEVNISFDGLTHLTSRVSEWTQRFMVAELEQRPSNWVGARADPLVRRLIDTVVTVMTRRTFPQN